MAQARQDHHNFSEEERALTKMVKMKHGGGQNTKGGKGRDST
jgi:hypothetical protein